MDAKQLIETSKKPFAETESGLVVPTHVLEEKRDAERKIVRWTQDKWNRYRRVFSELAKDHILIAPACGDCNSIIQVVDLDKAGPNDPVFVNGKGQAIKLPPNKFALRCNCSDRVVVRGV